MRLLLVLAGMVLAAGLAGATSVRIDAPSGAPATLFLQLDVVGNGTLALGVPPGTAIDALAVDGAPVAWRFEGPGRLRVPLPHNATELRLHGVLPGAGPWTFEGVSAAAFDAPGLAVTESGATVTVARRAPSGPSPWLAVAIAGGIAVLVAIGLAARDRRRAPPAESATLLDHLRELQKRLRVVLLALAILAIVFAAFGSAWIFPGGVRVPIVRPGEPTFAAAAYTSMAHAFVPPGVTLVALHPVDAVAAELWVAVLLAALATLPVAAYQIAAFVGPALLPGERRVAWRVAPLVAALFAAGAAFAWFLLAPFLLRTLYGFAPDLGAVPLLSVPDLVSFVAFLVLAMGLVFELPIIMAAVARAGIVRPATLASKWRHAVVGIFLVAALVTPDPTVVGQLFVAVPMTALYALGVAAAYAVSPRA